MADSAARFVYTPDFIIPPGESLKEVLDDLGLTQTELARRMGRPVQKINQIVNAKTAITPETAIQLESVLGIPASFWNNLQKNYEETLARLDANRIIETQTELAKAFPYAEMAKNGWVPATRKPSEKVRELLEFFGVAHLKQVDEVLPVRFRVSRAHQPSQHALTAWMRQGERLAWSRPVASYNEQALRDALPVFRQLTMCSSNDWCEQLITAAAECGVAVVLVPHLRQTYAHGATRWVRNRFVLQLSIRFAWADIFWFSFFHEVAHILLHGRSSVFIEYKERLNDPQEHEADLFARDVLIPQQEYEGFVRSGQYKSDQRIRTFAAQTGIPAGVVVGRLQHEGVIPHTYGNRLRTKLTWKSA